MQKYKLMKYLYKMNFEKKNIYKTKIANLIGGSHEIRICDSYDSMTQEGCTTSECILTFVIGDDQIRFKSKFFIVSNTWMLILNVDDGSLLSIIIDLTNNESTLDEIKSSSKWPFQKLMQIYFCITKFFNCNKMILDDKATFHINCDGDIEYKALIYRIFTNKDSIYSSFEFTNAHSTYTQDKYASDKQLIYESTVADWTNAFESCRTTHVQQTIIDDALAYLSSIDTESTMRSVITRLSDKSVDCKTKQHVSLILDCMTNHHVDECKKNRFVGAITRIDTFSRSMISTDIKCMFCPK